MRSPGILGVQERGDPVGHEVHCEFTPGYTASRHVYDAYLYRISAVYMAYLCVCGDTRISCVFEMYLCRILVVFVSYLCVSGDTRICFVYKAYMKRI